MAVDQLRGRFLLRWMFGFLRPVKWIVFFNCLWITAWVAAEALTTKQTARIVNTIQTLHPAEGTQSLWRWLVPNAFSAHDILGGLAGREVDFRYQVIGLLFIVSAYICCSAICGWCPARR